MQGGHMVVMGVLAVFFMVTDSLHRHGVLWERPLVDACRWLVEWWGAA